MKTIRKRFHTKNKKQPKKKDGLLSIQRRAAHQTLEQFAKEMHPIKKIRTDAEIKVCVMQINTTYKTSTETFIRTGDLLNELKKAMNANGKGHGKWLSLFKGCDKGRHSNRQKCSSSLGNARRKC